MDLECVCGGGEKIGVAVVHYDAGGAGEGVDVAGYGGCGGWGDGGAGGDEGAVGGAGEGLRVQDEGVGRGDGGEVVGHAVFDYLAGIRVVDHVVG